MAEQNATASDKTAGGQNSDTSTDNKNEGSQNSSNTSNDNKQSEGGREPAKTFTQDEVNSLLAKERKTAEKKAAEAEAKAKLSDDERLTAELAETRAALRERDTRDACLVQAEAAGVRNPRLFYNAYKSAIETDKNGAITNLKDVLAEAKRDAPELFGAPPAGSADGGTGKTLDKKITMNDWLRS